MAKKLPKLSIKIDTAALLAQFSALRGRHVGLWPPLPRGLLMFAVFASIVAAGYGLYWRGLFEELDMGRQQEEQLKAQYVDKIKQAVNLPALRKQKEQVLQFVSQLEKQLPSKAEMDALLSDINQAGLGRGLLFELFRPGTVDVKDYYAELPISIRVTGRYHDLGAFAADVSNLSRIVTLHNLNITQATSRDQPAGATLAMDATARTYRYLDSEEVAEQQRAKAARAQQQGARR
jgi:type IV pilus assembly protein PilO